MATFNFSLEEKVTIWKKTEFSVEAKTLEEAKKLAIKFHNEGNTEEIGWETIDNTVERITLKENNFQPTEEIYTSSYDKIWDNVDKEVKNSPYFYELHVNIDGEKGYSFGIKSDVMLDEEEAIEKAKELKNFEEIDDCNLIDTFEEIDEEDFKKWYPKEYNR
jgi:hypothetical protein